MSDIQFDARDNLNAVFDIYRTAGVLDEAVIIENIAFFALDWYCRKNIKDRQFESLQSLIREGAHRALQSLILLEIAQLLNKDDLYEKESLLASLLPSPPMDLSKEYLVKINELLQQIFDHVSNLGEWFDRDLLPRISYSPKGGRYATPRHLVRFMAGIVNLYHPRSQIALFQRRKSAICDRGYYKVDIVPGDDDPTTQKRVENFERLFEVSKRWSRALGEISETAESRARDYIDAMRDSGKPINADTVPAYIDAACSRMERNWGKSNYEYVATEWLRWAKDEKPALVSALMA